MKKLLLALMVMATIASCGKNNKVDSGAVAGTIGITNPLVTGSSQAQALVSMISNPALFGQGQIINSSTNETCGVKWGFNYCYNTGSSSGSTSTGQTWNSVVAANPNLVYQYSNNLTVRHVDVNVTTKQNELASLLNSATAVQVNGPIYYITVGAAYYVIDTRYPIQVQPSAVSSTSGAYYFIRAM